MATIGTFTGTIRTLSLNVKAKIIRAERTSDKGPDFRVLAGKVAFDAA